MLRDYIRSLTPVLDTEDKYMFFCINKVAQTSINRNLLKNRAIVFKDDPKNWYKKFDSYSDEEVNKLFKFTIVRNPWDKTVSFFFYYKRICDKKVHGYSNFNDFVCSCLSKYGADYDSHLELQYPKSYYKGKQFVDIIGRYETLDTDWKKIAEHIDAPLELPHSNKTRHKHYSSYYTKKSIDIVAKIYAKDIDIYNYTFTRKKTRILDYPVIQKLLRK